MRSLFHVFLGALLLLPALAQAQQCFPAPAGLVSWWPGDGNANDIVSTNDGTLVNGATFAPGQVDSAFSFDGVDDRVALGNDASLTGLNAGTVGAWIFVPSSAPGNANQDVLGYGGDGDGAFIVWVELDAASTAFTVNTFSLSPPSERNSVKTDALFSTDAWHHVAWISTGASYQIYVDGVNQPFSIVIGVNDGQWIGDISTINGTVNIGAHKGSGVLTEFFNGLIDELQVFDRALSGAEIQGIFEAGNAGQCKGEEVPAVDPIGLISLLGLIGVAGYQRLRS